MTDAWKVLNESNVDDALRQDIGRITDVDSYLTKNPGTASVIEQGLNDVGQYKSEFLDGIANATDDLSHLNGRSALPDEVADAVVSIKQYRTQVGEPTGGNYGYLKGQVGNVDPGNKMWRSVSLADAEQEIHIFDAIPAAGSNGKEWLRITDSEYRMLNKLANDLGAVKGGIYPEITGTLKIVSENPYCASCQGVIQQFNQMFPNVKLVLVDGVK